MKKNVINWAGIVTIVLGAIVLGFIGLGMPKTINTLNNYQEYHLYGYWASYVIISLLAYLLVGNIKIMKEKNGKLG